MNNKKELYYKYFDEKILSKVQDAEKFRIKLIKQLIFSSLFFFIIAGFYGFVPNIVIFYAINKKYEYSLAC